MPQHLVEYIVYIIINNINVTKMLIIHNKKNKDILQFITNTLNFTRHRCTQ